MSRRFPPATLLTPALAGVAIGLFLAARILGEPDAVAARDRGPSGAGPAIQGAFAELLLRQGGISSRTEPVVMTAADLNAFLARHLRARRLTLRPLVVRLDAGWLEVAGRRSLGDLLPRASPWGRIVPEPVRGLGLWAAARGRLEIRAGRAELVVERAALGRQRVPAAVLWGLLDVEPERMLRWPVLPVVERVEVEPGRLLIHTRPRRR